MLNLKHLLVDVQSHTVERSIVSVTRMEYRAMKDAFVRDAEIQKILSTSSVN